MKAAYNLKLWGKVLQSNYFPLTNYRGWLEHPEKILEVPFDLITKKYIELKIDFSTKHIKSDIQGCLIENFCKEYKDVYLHLHSGVYFKIEVYYDYIILKVVDYDIGEETHDETTYIDDEGYEVKQVYL